MENVSLFIWFVGSIFELSFNQNPFKALRFFKNEISELT